MCRFESCRGHSYGKAVTKMRHTIIGKTGRAQLLVYDLTGENVPPRQRKERPDFCVRLLPKNAHRSTAYSSAGDEVYFGPDLEKALMHIRAWTGLEDIDLPMHLSRRDSHSTSVGLAGGPSE